MTAIRKITAFLCAGVLAISVAACGSADSIAETKIQACAAASDDEQDSAETSQPDPYVGDEACAAASDEEHGLEETLQTDAESAEEALDPEEAAQPDSSNGDEADKAAAEETAPAASVKTNAAAGLSTEDTFDLNSIPAYAGDAYTRINGGIPFFSEEDKSNTTAFEYYSDLDELGRCGAAYANICTELMPTEERGEIGPVKPTGWHTVKYNDLINGNYLYNRCHLIGYQLAGENDNELNLITGTRYLNVEGMLGFEDEVAAYVKDTGNHVLYRVTPWFKEDELVARGVEMEAWSVEDAGEGICFHVYCYNVQPGIEIDYATGDSKEAEGSDTDTGQEEREYVLNTNTKKFHLPTCSSVSDMAEHNKKVVTGTIDEIKAEGYTPCARCLEEYRNS